MTMRRMRYWQRFFRVMASPKIAGNAAKVSLVVGTMLNLINQGEYLLSGQFVLGLLLGVVWSPCVGPTLGATITLASQGRQLAQVMLVMALFGLGAGLPLVILGSLSREAMLRMRGKLLAAGRQGTKVLGALMLLLGAFIVTGLDKRFETWVLDVAPAWLIQIGTSL